MEFASSLRPTYSALVAKQASSLNVNDFRLRAVEVLEAGWDMAEFWPVTGHTV